MMPVRFSTSRNSKPPASLVMDPPSNCPRISRCFRGRNGNGSWLHSVVIRLSPFVGVTDTLNTFYATKRQPLLFFNEKCGLVTPPPPSLFFRISRLQYFFRQTIEPQWLIGKFFCCNSYRRHFSLRNTLWGGKR